MRGNAVIWALLLLIAVKGGPGHGHGGHGHTAVSHNVANFRTVEDRVVPTLERARVVERGHAHVPEVERGVINSVERRDSHFHSTEQRLVPKTWTQEIPHPRVVTDHEPQHAHRYNPEP